MCSHSKPCVLSLRFFRKHTAVDAGVLPLLACAAVANPELVPFETCALTTVLHVHRFLVGSKRMFSMSSSIYRSHHKVSIAL